INKGDNKICFCSLEGIINVISKKWALVMIGTIGNHEKIRFNELMKLLLGISPKTLADRLKEQEKAGLIKREAFAEIPPRVEYSLTRDGIEVRDAMLPLMAWVHKKSTRDKKVFE
ncbi:MAG: winged helix-turn-helix transcriptional regulator, partial [Candidatus Hodarchaeales archaeon]